MAGPTRLSDSVVVKHVIDGNATGTAIPVFVAHRQLTLRKAYVSVATAPTGTSETYAIEAPTGTAVGTLTLAATETSASADLDVDLAVGDRIEVDITAGGTSAGVDPVIVLELD